MSYILDALKKADAQRERDPARGIHAQPAALAPARRVTGGSSSLWAGVAAVVVVVAGIGWYVAQDRPVAPAAPAVVAHADAVPAAVTPAPAVATVAAPPVVAQAGVAAPAPATAVLPPPEPTRVAPREEADGDGAQSTRRHRASTRAVAAAPVTASSAPAAARATAAASNAGASSVAAAAAPAKTGAAAPTSGAPEAAPITNGWPADAPKLAIGGGVYSPNRAQRMLIVNDQVVKEGADLGAGVVLEEIKAKSAVLRFRGSRYSVGF